MAIKQVNQKIFESNWLVIIWENLLRTKGIILPPTYFFGLNDGDLIEKVKECIPEKDWGHRDDGEMTSYIQLETRKALNYLFTFYLNNSFPKNQHPEGLVSVIGTRVLFFLLVFVIKEDLIESKEELRNFFKSSSLRGNFWAATHEEYTEELFSFAV